MDIHFDLNQFLEMAEKLQNIIQAEKFDELAEELKKEAIRTEKNYQRGILTTEERDDVYGYFHIMGVAKLCGFFETELALMSYLWGSVLPWEAYFRMEKDYALYRQEKECDSKEGVAWLYQNHGAIGEVSGWDGKYDNKNAEAESGQKKQFFAICDAMHIHPLEWFTYPPKNMEFPKVSPFLHLYNNGSFVRIMMDFAPEEAFSYDDSLLGKTCNFVALDGTKAWVQVEKCEYGSYVGKGEIETYTITDELVEISFSKDEKKGTYRLSYFYDLRHDREEEKKDNQFLYHPKWDAFWKWEKEKIAPWKKSFFLIY